MSDQEEKILVDAGVWDELCAFVRISAYPESVIFDDIPYRCLEEWGVDICNRMNISSKDAHDFIYEMGV